MSHCSRIILISIWVYDTICCLFVFHSSAVVVVVVIIIIIIIIIFTNSIYKHFDMGLIFVGIIQMRKVILGLYT